MGWVRKEPAYVNVIAQSADMPAAAAGRLAADIIAAIKGQIARLAPH